MADLKNLKEVQIWIKKRFSKKFSHLSWSISFIKTLSSPDFETALWIRLFPWKLRFYFVWKYSDFLDFFVSERKANRISDWVFGLLYFSNKVLSLKIRMDFCFLIFEKRRESKILVQNLQKFQSLWILFSRLCKLANQIDNHFCPSNLILYQNP